MFRRGKLSFLNTKDDRIKIINERINLTERHLVEVCSAFATCTRKMAKFRDSYDELAKGIKTYADDEEVNESMSAGLKSFTNAVTILSDYMDINVYRMEAKVVNELAQYEHLCKTTRDNLRLAVIARDKEVLKQRQMLEIKSKFAANNSAADTELLKAKLEVNRTNKEIDEIIANFEKRKLSDVKSILSDFILISMKYHTKALEVLSANYYDVNNIDEKDDFLEFQKLMKTKEEPAARKGLLKKGIRSQSMDSLDREHLGSPLKRSSKHSKSTKNLASSTNDEADEEEDETADDDEEDEEEESETNDEEDVSGSVTDEEPETKENVFGVKTRANKSDSMTVNNFKAKPKSTVKHPFKAVAATHVPKQKINRNRSSKSQSFAIDSIGGVKGIGIPGPAGITSESNGMGTRDINGGGRLVTLVESKRKSGMERNSEAIDCTLRLSNRNMML